MGRPPFPHPAQQKEATRTIYAENAQHDALDVREPPSLNDGAVFIGGSILDRSKLREIFRGCDYIVHMAGCEATGHSAEWAVDRLGSTGDHREVQGFLEQRRKTACFMVDLGAFVQIGLKLLPGRVSGCTQWRERFVVKHPQRQHQGAAGGENVAPGPFQDAARGAAGGALIGAISGNAGRGAAIVAGFGAVRSAVRRGSARSAGACY